MVHRLLERQYETTKTRLRPKMPVGIEALFGVVSRGGNLRKIYDAHILFFRKRHALLRSKHILGETCESSISYLSFPACINNIFLRTYNILYDLCERARIDKNIYFTFFFYICRYLTNLFSQLFIAQNDDTNKGKILCVLYNTKVLC